MRTLHGVVAGLMLCCTLAVSSAHPAQADQAAVRRNILLGAAALVAGIAIEANVAHKHQQANTVQGYLPNGGTVYGDGRVVQPDGQSYYPANYGQRVACNAGACYIIAGNGQNYNGYNNSGYNNYNDNTHNGYDPYQPSGNYDPSGNADYQYLQPASSTANLSANVRRSHRRHRTH